MVISVVTYLLAGDDLVEEGVGLHGLGHNGAPHGPVVVRGVLPRGQVLGAQLHHKDKCINDKNNDWFYSA